MNAYLLIFLGAGLGGMARHAVNTGCGRWCGDNFANFPLGIFIVNVTGCFIMGLAAGLFALKTGPGWTQDARIFLTTGVLGGYTTFSTFSLDAVTLWQNGAFFNAALYVLGSAALSIAAVFAGLALARMAT